MIQEKKGQVLCVDDEPALLRSLQWLLEKDFDVTIALGGEEGLREIEAHEFDVIVSDQRMPGMTGAEFLSRAKTLSPRAVRILLTGYTDMEALLSSVNEGEIWRFVKKPWNREELSSLVETATKIAKEGGFADFETPIESTGESKVLVISNDADIHRTFKENPVDNVHIIHADNLAQAVQVIANERIGAIVSEVTIGSTDVTQFISLLKQIQPEIVSVVVAEETDLQQLIKLINDGQVYRYTKKPVQESYLKHLVSSAVTKHLQLAAEPATRARYAVSETGETLAQTLMQELGLSSSEPVEYRRQDIHGSQRTNGEPNGAGKFRQIFKKWFGRE
ncbi:response regulator [Candidatus Entotheonella palauensis]|uniref:Response regulatory domain-containing protein n=1 Tax=Candidatus Entotheonella gemina TaxID=1429439 RepID=W4M2U1_9BACT|nr:response regulator [Candidatus Entotheonella palauensis]ETX04664.1 MAG: hypothetical protein ETSY2_27495 [Candidatus Entotheonella gemina]